MILYDPNQIGFFHTTACITIREAKRKGTIKNFRQVPDGTTLFRIYGQRPERLFKCPQCDKEEKSGKTPTQTWNGIKVPEINNNEILPDCFLLYTPESPSKIFHFMKCSRVCEDEKNNHLEGYRFTNKAWFEDFSGNVINVEPCPNCKSEWDNGNGWNTNFYDDFFRYCLNYHNKNENKKFPPDLEKLYDLMRQDKIFISAAIKNERPNNWDKISKAYIMSREYRCKDCRVNLKKYPGLAKVHCINDCLFDVRPDNIIVLCEECYQKRLYRGDAIHLSQKVSNLLQRLRREQGIIP